MGSWARNVSLVPLLPRSWHNGAAMTGAAGQLDYLQLDNEPDVDEIKLFDKFTQITPDLGLC